MLTSNAISFFFQFLAYYLESRYLKILWFWGSKYDQIYKLIECQQRGLFGRIFVTEVLKFGWATEYSTGISWDWYKYVYFKQYLGNSYMKIFEDHQ